MKRSNTFYVGVLLEASKNSANKIEFAIDKEGQKSVLYSRTGGFGKKFDKNKAKRIGKAVDTEALLTPVLKAAETMKSRGITLPICDVVEL